MAEPLVRERVVYETRLGELRLEDKSHDLENYGPDYADHSNLETTQACWMVWLGEENIGYVATTRWTDPDDENFWMLYWWTCFDGDKQYWVKHIEIDGMLGALSHLYARWLGPNGRK